MKTSSYSACWRYAALLLMALPIAGVAETPDESYSTARVARLSYIQGEVSIQPAGVDEWLQAVVNRPLTTDDKLETHRDARAELDTGMAVVRLGADTGFSFLKLDENTIQMRVTAGTLYVRVRDLGENDSIEVDTPNLALTLLREGRYRVEVNEAGDATVIKVSAGEAAVASSGQTTLVRAQQSVTFTGTQQLAAQFETLGAPDSFDEWCLERDRRDEQSESARYVSADVVGYEDLDDYGTWRTVPDYGDVWIPTVAAGWSPYSFGHWSFISPWGWTWIDRSPWGFAPFHYGRWAYISRRWCWVPGPRHTRPGYAPSVWPAIPSSDRRMRVPERPGLTGPAQRMNVAPERGEPFTRSYRTLRDTPAFRSDAHRLDPTLRFERPAIADAPARINPPGRIERPVMRPVIPPGSGGEARGLPSRSQPVPVERPVRVERPIRADRPAPMERASRVQRPTPVERPAQAQGAGGTGSAYGQASRQPPPAQQPAGQSRPGGLRSLQR